MVFPLSTRPPDRFTPIYLKPPGEYDISGEPMKPSVIQTSGFRLRAFFACLCPHEIAGCLKRRGEVLKVFCTTPSALLAAPRNAPCSLCTVPYYASGRKLQHGTEASSSPPTSEKRTLVSWILARLTHRGKVCNQVASPWHLSSSSQFRIPPCSHCPQASLACASIVLYCTVL
jgi:hypothetical protein